MINTRQLEKKWYKYKAKKVFSILFAFFFLLLLSTGLYYGYTKYIEKKSQEKSELEALKKLELTNKENTIALENAKIEKVALIENEVVPEREKLSLEPVIPMIDMEKEERKKSHIVSVKKPHIKKPQVKSHPKKSTKHVKAKTSAYLTDKELATMNGSLDSRKIKKINMTKSSANYIETMKKKFIATKKPREALLLAKAYYAKGEYAKAEEWALRANKLNNKSDESWLMFAKSKAKLGQKDEALKILISYYKKSHSTKAKALIEKIKTERL